MRLARRGAGRPSVSIVPMIDVLMILLFFFMVTSTYLDLDMLPLRTGDVPAEMSDSTADGAARQAPVVLLRLGPDGTVRYRGGGLDAAALAQVLAEARSDGRAPRVMVLPAPQAPAQALVDLMALLSAGGVTDMRVVPLKGAN